MDATVDVGGEVRRTPWFPEVDDFPLAGRATIAATAAFDHWLRTAASAAIVGQLPRTLWNVGALARDVRSLDFYEALADAGDREAIFPTASRPPEVDVISREPVRWRWLPGTLDLLRAPSEYVPLNPSVRSNYADFGPNRSAWAQHWRHDDGARPTVIVLHGFMASQYWLNRMFFSLPWWYSNGYDLLLVTLPFHGIRSRRGVLDGTGLFTNGPGHLIEGLLHAIADLRSWIDHLEEQGVEQVGVTGVSLGGYVAALLAAADPRLWFSIPNVPVADMVEGMRSWQPSGTITRGIYRTLGTDDSQFSSAMRVASPLHHPSLLDRDRLFIVTGLGDRLAPPHHAQQLWEHWGHPSIHAFPGNHMLHIERGAYLRRIGRFIRSTGFGV